MTNSRNSVNKNFKKTAASAASTVSTKHFKNGAVKSSGCGGGYDSPPPLTTHSNSTIDHHHHHQPMLSNSPTESSSNCIRVSSETSTDSSSNISDAYFVSMRKKHRKQSVRRSPQQKQQNDSHCYFNGTQNHNYQSQNQQSQQQPGWASAGKRFGNGGNQKNYRKYQRSPQSYSHNSQIPSSTFGWRSGSSNSAPKCPSKQLSPLLCVDGGKKLPYHILLDIALTHFASSKCFNAPAPTALPKPPEHWLCSA